MNTTGRGACCQRARPTEDVLEIERVLADARWHHAAVMALRDGDVVPRRGEPCYFDLRHGPAVVETGWTAPSGAEHVVAVCAADAERLTRDEAPGIRMVRVADRHLPWHDVGDVAGVLRLARELTDAASLNTGHHSHLTRHPSFEGSEGLS
jgi:hypothetical protein